jgi:hypothetical protein
VLGRVLGLLFGFIAAVFLVTLAVANRHAVRLVLDPFNPTDPVLAAQLPFYAYLFGMLIIGVVMGGVATWFSQGRWRRVARARAQDAVRWRGEAERLSRERDARVAAAKAGGQSDARQLALTGR